MPADAAELSSLATQIVQLTSRVTAMAEAASVAHEDGLASELFGLERALGGAQRRIERITNPRR